MLFTLARLARVSGWAGPRTRSWSGSSSSSRRSAPVAGSESYANLHDHLMSWEECQPLAARFCEQAGIPSEPSALTAFYRRKLAGIAAGGGDVVVVDDDDDRGAGRVQFAEQVDDFGAGVDDRPLAFGHGAAEAFGLRQGRTVAANRSSFPVRVSFHMRWKAPALAVMPW